MRNFSNVINRLSLRDKLELLILKNNKTKEISELNIPSISFKELSINDIKPELYCSNLNVLKDYFAFNKIENFIILDFKLPLSDDPNYNLMCYESLIAGITKKEFVFLKNFPKTYDNSVVLYDDEVKEECEYVAVNTDDYIKVIKAIKMGASFIFGGNEELINQIYNKIEEARSLALKFKEGQITNEEYNEYLKANEENLIDENIIDLRINTMLNVLASANLLKENDFDESYESNYETYNKKVALDSLVLIKNDNNVLPLKEGIKTYAIGQLLNDLGQLTIPNLIDTNNGWENDGYINDNVLDKLRVNLESVDVVLVFIDGVNGKLTLGQKTLIDLLVELNKRIVCFINCDSNFDLEFSKNVDALVYIPKVLPLTISYINSLLIGETNFSGHLVNRLSQYNTFSGLSYNVFNYDKLSIYENVLSFTLINKSNYKSNVNFYVYFKTDTENKLISVKQININANKSDKVYIDIEPDSIKNNGALLIYNGDVLALESQINKEIKVEPTYVIEDYNNDFAKEEIYQNKPLKRNLVLNIILTILITLLLSSPFYLIYYNTNNVFSNISFVIAIIFIVLGVIYLILSIIGFVKKSKVKETKQVDLRKLKEFSNVVRESYEKVIPEESLVKEETKVEEVKIKEAEFSIKEEHVEVSNFNFTSFVTDLLNHLKNNGIVTDYMTIRKLLACMAASKLIIIPNKTDLILRFMTLFSEFLGLENNYVDYDKNKLIYKELNVEANQYTMTGLASNLLNAANNHEQIYLNVIKSSSLEVIDTMNLELENISKNNKKVYLNLSDYKRVLLPHNIWYFLVLDNVNFEVMEKGFVLDLKLEEIEIEKNIVGDFKAKNIKAFREEVRIARNNSYLSEKSWQMLDSLLDEVSSKTKYNLDNKNLLAIEALSAVYNELANDEEETIDVILSSKLIPLIKELPYYNNENSSKLLKELLDNNFKNIQLTNTLKLLN